MFNTPFQMAVEQFDAKHGADAIRIDGWFLYSNGARREDSQPYGMLLDPPKDIRECGKWRIKYREELLRRATEKFNELRQRLKTHIDNVRKYADSNSPPSPPTEAQFEALEDAKAVVVRSQRALERVRTEVKDAYENQPEVIERARRAAAKREEAAAAQDRLEKIKV